MTRAPADQHVRDRVASDFDTTFLLEAGAGTGKTTTLVRRIVALLQSGRVRIDRLAAITFTEKAAAELKLRVREALDAAIETAADPTQRERLTAAAAGLDRAQITTIHSFAMALLKERPFEAGLDPGFRIAADVTGERSFDEAWDEWIDARFSEGEPVFVDALHLGVTPNDLRQAARQVVGDRDILGQSVSGIPEADAGPLRQRVQQKAAQLAQLKPHCLDESDGATRSIEELEAFADRSSRAEGAALKGLLLTLKPSYTKGSQKNWNDKETLKHIKAELKALRDEVERFKKLTYASIAMALRNRLADFAGHFEKRQREAALVDFQGLLLEARNLLANNKAVRRYFQRRIDALLIDEFQDTDPLQVELAFFLAEDAEKEPADDWRSVRLTPGKLFLVGDPRQSIYRFRRADLGIYVQASERIEQGGGEVLRLTSNFRSVPSVVSFVNDRFGAIFKTDPDSDPEPIALVPERPEVHRNGARVLTLPIPHAQLPIDPRDDKADIMRPLLANVIAGFVEQVTQTRPWSVRDGDSLRPARPGDIGLLIRQLTGIEFLEEALRARGIGFRLVGGKAYHQRGEVAALRAVLLAIDNAADRLTLVQALRSPFFGISDADLASFVARGGTLTYNAPIPEALEISPIAAAFDVLQRLHRQRRIDPPSQVVRRLLERTRALPGFLLSRDGSQAVANLWKIVEIAQAYEAAGQATLRGFVRFLTDQARDAREEGDSPVGDEAGQNVEILTVHRAKGLEYPIVVIADILASARARDKAFLDHRTGEGWLEIGKIAPPGFEDRKQIEKRRADAEERRLLYVALTRARDHLVLPVLPLERDKVWRSSWVAPILGAVAPASEPDMESHWGAVIKARGEAGAPFTCLDTRPFFPAPVAAPGPHPADALEGGDEELAAARAAQEAWEQVRKNRERAGESSGTLRPSAAVTDVASSQDKKRPPSSDGSAANFGKLVHALLARCALDGADLDALGESLAPDFEMDTAGVSAATALVRQTLAQPLFDRVRKAERVLREAPIAATLEGQRIGGVMDLAFLEAGRWTVVEYKTGHAGEANSTAEQLRLYGQALQIATDLPVVVEVCSVTASHQ